MLGEHTKLEFFTFVINIDPERFREGIIYKN